MNILVLHACGPNPHTYTYIHLAWHVTGLVPTLTLTYIPVYTYLHVYICTPGMARYRCGPTSHTYTYTYIHIYMYTYTHWHGMVQVWSQLSHLHIYIYTPGMARYRCGFTSHTHIYTCIHMYIHLAWHGTGMVPPVLPRCGPFRSRCSLRQ